MMKRGKLLLVSLVVFFVLLICVVEVRADLCRDSSLIKIYQKGMSCSWSACGDVILRDCFNLILCPSGYSSIGTHTSCETSGRPKFSCYISGCFPTFNNRKCWRICKKDLSGTSITSVDFVDEDAGTCSSCYSQINCPSGYVEYTRWCDKQGTAFTSCIKSCVKCESGWENRDGDWANGCEYQTLPPQCTDSDGGKNYDVRGTCTGINGAYIDYCHNSTLLYEYYCHSNNNCYGDLKECPCQDGKCGGGGGCTDTDGGDNKIVKGTCTNATGSYTDVCLTGPQGEPIVKEYYCVGTLCDATEYNCQFYGYPYCSNGQCVGGVECNCGSCSECSAKLNTSGCGIVKLTTDILNTPNTCIDPGYQSNFNNKIFDCQNHIIDGDDAEFDYGIKVSGQTGNTIKNCTFTDWFTGIGLLESNSTIVINNTVRSTNRYGILAQGFNNQITKNVVESNIKFGSAISAGLSIQGTGKGNSITLNRLCNNENQDIYNSTTAQNSGSDNTCDVPYNWNDQGRTGCTNPCSALPPLCKINSATVAPNCAGGLSANCENGENITLNITVQDFAKCEDVHVNKIEIDVKDTAQPPDGECFAYMINSTPIQKDSANKRYFANWTILIPANCENRPVSAYLSKLFNLTGQIVTGSATGTFTFASELPPQPVCKITEAKIKLYCGNDGWCNESEKIELNITVEDMSKCLNVNKMEIIASSTGSGVQPPTGSVVGGEPSITVTMNNMTVVTKDIVNKRYISNWTVPNPIPANLKGKTMNASIARIYNGTYANVKIGEKTKGNFGIFKFASGAPGGQCYCVDSSHPCGVCYDSKTKCVGPTHPGQIVPCTSPTPNCQGNVCVADINPSICHGNNTEVKCNKTDLWGNCYWDFPQGLSGNIYCKHCYKDNEGPVTCSGYDNKSTCDLDTCYVGNYNCPANAEDCWCAWDTTTTVPKCVQKIQYGTSGGQSYCEYSRSYGNCEDGCQGNSNQREMITTCITSPTCKSDYSDCVLTSYQQTETECITCGMTFKPLPFFAWWNVLAVLSLIIVIYVFINTKKK